MMNLNLIISSFPVLQTNNQRYSNTEAVRFLSYSIILIVNLIICKSYYIFFFCVADQQPKVLQHRGCEIPHPKLQQRWLFQSLAGQLCHHGKNHSLRCCAVCRPRKVEKCLKVGHQRRSVSRNSYQLLGRYQGLLYHRTCKPVFLCSWPSLNSYLE